MNLVDQEQLIWALYGRGSMGGLCRAGRAYLGIVGLEHVRDRFGSGTTYMGFVDQSTYMRL